MRCLLLLFASLNVLPCVGGVLVATNSSWRFFKGYSEASTPDVTAWRQLGFDDSAWVTSRAAFYYENQPGSSTTYTGNTVLTDMFGHYTCIFLRQTFVVTNVYDVAALQIAALSDDGFIAWINGQEVGRFNMPAGDVPYNGTSSPALPEPIPWWTNTVSDLQSFLVPGVNVLAVQAFNSSIGSSSDFIINPALYYVPDLTIPTLTLIYPETNSIVRQLTSIEVAFSKAVAGVGASDLLINGQPATDLTTVTPSQFVFSFSQPATGAVQVAWAPGHGIHDLSSASNALGGGSWSYTLDSNAPVQGVMISEFMAANSGNQANSLHDELGNSPDWIELYNPATRPIALGGLYLSNAEGAPGLDQIPALSFIAANGYVSFTEDGNTAQGADHLNFKLDAEVGIIILSDPALTTIDAINYGPQQTDVAQGRSPSGSDTLVSFSQPTPGSPNPTPNGTISVTNVSTLTVHLLTITNSWKYSNSGGTNFGTAGSAALPINPKAIAARTLTPAFALVSIPINGWTLSAPMAARDQAPWS